PFSHPMFETEYPSRGTQKNSKPKLKDFGENRYLLTIEFIEKARVIAPEIAFGICLQFYGGLRRGEVVNITRGNIIEKFRTSMNIEIRDNRHLLFQHLRDTSKENPKRLNYLQIQMANQTILDNELLWEVYEDHLKTLKINGERNEIKDYSALFVDQDGKAMSGNVYERKFKKVKKYFLQELKGVESREEDFVLLSESYWGTHIGRGNFTNFLFDMGLTITQIAIARGDSSID
ncbi:site-specific integrase, partial [Paenibacillus sp. TAF58]